MKRLLFLALLLVGCVFASDTANAHVLITNDSKRFSAILHVEPDDDPVAGTKDDIFFDIQSKFLENEDFSATLTIKDPSGQQVELPVAIHQNTIRATYAFPSQGAYELTLTITTSATSYRLAYTQRVARGVIATPFDQPSSVWAEAVIAASSCGLVVLAIMVINKRKQISQQSRL